jgi:hypothetical protein
MDGLAHDSVVQKRMLTGRETDVHVGAGSRAPSIEQYVSYGHASVLNKYTYYAWQYVQTMQNVDSWTTV